MSEVPRGQAPRHSACPACRFYSLGSGSGGHNASHERVSALREEDGSYTTVKFYYPTGTTLLRENIDTAREAIQEARRRAENRVSREMPGTGKIEAPPFDFSRVPDEPE